MTLRRLAVLMAVALMWQTVAAALPSGYHGELGNREEPALRPYKCMLRGVFAFFYQTGTALRDGNMKLPVLGSIEAVAGVRRGTVELGRSTVNGLTFAEPPWGGATEPDFREHIKHTGKVNHAIEKDPMLRTVLNAGSTTIVDTLRVVDKDTVGQTELEAKTTREARKEEAARKKAQAREESAVREAQRQYLGDRFVEPTKDPYTGDLTKLAR